MGKAEDITRKYEEATATSLDQVYGRYSKEKADAFERCRRLMVDHDGWGLKILSANTYMFTAGFEFVPEDTETGCICIMYITPKREEVVEWSGSEVI